MSILSSIKSKAKSAISKAKSVIKSTASNIVSGVKSIGNTLKTTVSNTKKTDSLASASSALRTLQSRNQTIAPNISTPQGIGQTQKNGSIVLLNNQGRPTGDIATRGGSGMSVNSYGGYTPVPKTLGAGQRSSSSSPTSLSTMRLGSGSSLQGSPSSSLNITSSSLSSAPSISLPNAPSYANVSSVTNAGLAGAMKDSGQAYDPASGLFVPDVPVDSAQTEEERRKKDFQELLGMIPEKQSVFEDKQVKKQQAEVNARKEEVNNATAQLNNIVAKRDADLLKVRGVGSAEGVTEAVYGGQAATIEREAAIRALPIQAQVAAAQGNLQLAQDYLSELITVKKDQIDADYEYNTTKFKAIEGFLSKEEKIRLDKITKDEERAYNTANKNLDLQDSWSKYAIENGQGYLVSRIHGLNAGSPTFREDLSKIIGQIRPKETGGSTADETVQTYANLLAQGKITLSNVPQGIRNAVVLASNGVVNKPLSDTAIKEITQTESALQNLEALKTVVQNNLEFIGPIKGLSRYNPYSDARQAQAEVDRVRQVVGKALEGGVLRKEDEEKYKKILATLSDTPETALYKIDALTGQLERDLANYRETQSESGVYVGNNSSVTSPEELRAKYNY